MWCPCAYSRVGKYKYRGKARDFHFTVTIISVFEFWMESVKTSGIFLLMMLNSTLKCLVTMTVPREFVIKKKKTKRKITLTSQQRMNSLSLQAAVLEAHGGVFDTCTYRTIPWELNIHPCNIFNERFSHQFILGTWER